MNRPPPSVLLATLALAAAIAGIAWLTAQAGAERPAWGQVAFAALLGALILGGLLGRMRLAWLWGRSLALLLGLVEVVALGGALLQGGPRAPVTLALLGGVAAALLGAFAALGRRSALAWFGLICPACLTPSRTAADLLFRRVRCRKCGNVW